jgi:hypothetical protein
VKSGDRPSVGIGQNANAADSSIQNKVVKAAANFPLLI